MSHHAAENLETTRLNYIRWCNKEAMRLFPVAPFITRILAKPLEIDGYHLPASKFARMVYLRPYFVGSAPLHLFIDVFNFSMASSYQKLRASM